MSDRDPRLKDEEAQRVLARALELQSQGAETLSIAQVRQIAAELAIPETAVDQALSEHLAGAALSSVAPRAARTSYWERHRVARVVMGVVGVAFVLYAFLRMIVVQAP